MLYYKVETVEQRDAIHALAYHVADVNYIKERYGANDPEYLKADINVKDMFGILDKLRVPYWVQNTVICFAENWRRYQDTYLDTYLKGKGIIL